MPTVEAIKALEKACVDGATPLARYAAAVFRLQLGSSARWNDIQHSAPHTIEDKGDTIEATPWQTKTTKIGATT